MKLSTKIILPIIIISALLILLAGCFGVPPDDESPGYTPGAISGTIARPEVCCGEPSESSLVGDAIDPNVCDDLDLCDPAYMANWYAWANVEVTLTTWVDCTEVEIASTITDENGDYLFSDVPPGRNYIITAICPEEIDFKVKDVAEEVVEGATYDAGISDAESTVLALCLEGLGEICLDSDALDLDNFRNHFKYNKVACEVCEKLAECLYAMPVWVCEITELCPGYVGGDDDGDDDDVCEDPTVNAGGPYTDDEVCPPGADSTINFNGTASGTGTLKYDWDFGDGTGALDAGATPSHEYLNPFTGSPYTVTLTVTDDCGSTTNTATVTITECINDAPVIDNLPPTTTQEVDIWQTYTYDVDATDPNGDTLIYSLTVNPNGMVIDPSTGVITWTCANCDGLVCADRSEVKSEVNRCHKLCDIPVTVKVTSGGCCGPLFDVESFTVEVWQP